MNYIFVLQDSIDTSVSMKIFTNREDATMAHIFKSKLIKIPLSIFKDTNNVDNFDPDRLKMSAEDAYPLPNGRPRGDKDISSVKFYQTQIQQKQDITPIWMIQENHKYILLDGAHRIVASYIEDNKYINTYIIQNSKSKFER
jgi:hypothetical protein